MKPTNKLRWCLRLATLVDCFDGQEFQQHQTVLQQWWEKETSDMTVWGGGTGINTMPPENLIPGEWRDVVTEEENKEA